MFIAAWLAVFFLIIIMNNRFGSKIQMMNEQINVDRSLWTKPQWKKALAVHDERLNEKWLLNSTMYVPSDFQPKKRKTKV